MVAGKVVVDHGVDVFDVDPPSGDIGGDQGTRFALRECVQGSSSLVLRPTAVYRNRRDLFSLQLFDQPVGAVSRPGEDDGPPRLADESRRVAGAVGPCHVPEVVGRLDFSSS